MTTPPKARKFRLRPDSPLSGLNAAAPDAAATAAAAEMPFAETDDGFGEESFPTAEPEARPAAPEDPAAAIAAIHAEGLTGRQLRMARRLAQKHGIDTASDYEAVYLLRKQGIDPFQRANMLELVTDQAQAAGAVGGQIQSPRLADGGPKLPSTDILTEDGRAREIMRMQRDIVRRRRQKLRRLALRLFLFVGLPTLVAGWYYYVVATPLYSTNSEFVIQQAESQLAGGLGGMFAGTQFATSQDSIAVQGYLQSREAAQRLDTDQGFRAHFSQDFVDPVQRLDAGASSEAAYRLYKRNVKIGYDPTEGIIKMEVIAADPATSEAFSRALIGYAEEQVDHLTQRLREDQMQGARDSYEDAEAKVQAAQARVLGLQQQLGVLDPASESSVLMGQISTFEVQLQEKRLQLRQLLDNAQPNQARVDGVRGDITRLETLIADLRAQLTDDVSGKASLASVTGELRIAETDLQTRQMLLSQALQQLETARIEANRQVRYLSISAAPVAPDEPTYPRAFENTLLAFLIFGGIYLMLSLTASILREQVSG